MTTDSGRMYLYGEKGAVLLSDSGTGYGTYSDSQYTSSSPLVIPNDGEFHEINIDSLKLKAESQLPFGITTFYKDGKITPGDSGDGYSFSLGFKGTSSINNGSATFAIDIGGSFGRIFPRNFRFPRGTSSIHDFYLTSQGYAGDTFLANGGKVVISSDSGISSIYDIVLQVHRTHKAITK